MLIRLNVQPLSWKRKPTNNEVAYRIRNDLAKRTLDISPEDLADGIERGYTFTEGAMNGTTEESWLSQQLLCVDIDNGTSVTLRDENGKAITDQEGKEVRKFYPIENPLTVSEALAVIEPVNIEPYFVYYTFSNEKTYKEHGVNRFRIVCVLDRPITNPDKMREYKTNFAYLFNSYRKGCADTSTKDLARLYFGSVKGSVIRPITASVTDVSKLEYLPKKPPEKVVKAVRKPANTLSVSDADLIERACQSDEVFNQLWHGDTRAKPNLSEADCTLCARLLWWTNGDINRTDSLFRQSGLMRSDKWDSPRPDYYTRAQSTYGMYTIEKAEDRYYNGGGYDPCYYQKQIIGKLTRYDSLPELDDW